MSVILKASEVAPGISMRCLLTFSPEELQALKEYMRRTDVFASKGPNHQIIVADANWLINDEVTANRLRSAREKILSWTALVVQPEEPSQVL